MAMKRIDVIREISKRKGLIICNLGFPSRELYSIKDKNTNFYMLGSMGMVSSIGLGVALCQKEKVYIIEGDGSILMNLGSLATIAAYATPNLNLIVVDNGVYGSTGKQPTHTAKVADLKKIAKGAGNKKVFEVKSIEQLKEALEQSGPLIIVAKANQESKKVPEVPLEAEFIKKRFMNTIYELNK